MIRCSVLGPESRHLYESSRGLEKHSFLSEIVKTGGGLL